MKFPTASSVACSKPHFLLASFARSRYRHRKNWRLYQLTTYAFADQDLHRQMRELLSLEQTRRTPLLQGPYFSLSRAFARGAEVQALVDEGVLHPFMPKLIPHKSLYKHQEQAIRSILHGHSTLVSTGTGSGKTECFLYPIIHRCLQLRDQKAPAGIVAVLVYPMNALAEDQLGRLRALLAGTGITFGMYVGSTPNTEAEVTGQRLAPGTSNTEYDFALQQAQAERRGAAVHPPEERCSRRMMQTPGEQPRILLTNVKQLELLLTRSADVELFDHAQLEYLVFDEAHTFNGAGGAESACLIRRLRAFCGKGADETVCVATSATITDPDTGLEAGRKFAARFFGVKPESVTLVKEEYERDLWAESRTVTPPLFGNPYAHLQAALQAVDADNAGAAINAVCQTVAGQSISPDTWQESLYELLTANEIVYQLADNLRMPRSLKDLLQVLEKKVGRPIPEEELLVWLTLGAAARKDSRPLLRPVVHAFVRGVGGAVVTFPSGETRPHLYLSVEQEEAERTDAQLLPLKVLTCNTCGQHYFEHYVKDFQFTGNAPGGGDAEGDGHVWPFLSEAQGGRRVLLFDKLVDAEEDDAAPNRTAEVHLCRHCGALHPQAADRCADCGMKGPLVRLLAAQQKEDHPGKLPSCVSCKSPGGFTGGRYREPIRPVRAVTVADVHVLAQEMIRHSERPRLLVFADNRQDAAFQAGWMKDHARRFRLRALMWERMMHGPVSVGDLVAHLDEKLNDDDGLSRALIPEVWEVEPKSTTGVKHADERKYFLRIQVLRELTTGVKQRIGLEPWGRLQVTYAGLSADDAFITEKAQQYDIAPELLLQGISTILDVARRQSHLYDPLKQIFSKFWNEDAREISQGYLPLLKGIPKGLKLQRGPSDDDSRVTQWLSVRGATMVRQLVRSWDIPAEDVDAFITALWGYCKDSKILHPVTLTGSHGKALPNCFGTFQIDADRLYLTPHHGAWRCGKCRRVYTRPTPLDRCPTWRCDGTLAFEDEGTENYDLGLLDGAFHMLRAHEHSAQVPHTDRERLERLFKGDGEAINTLVCTPTLELGVDIGGLDAVLMRNVPPLPANYWQRAGRAGRRHRMAVNITYARPASHDRFYFIDPLRMLEGEVEPPSFNLQNAVMVRKHIHAAVLTRLHQLARTGSGLPEIARMQIETTLDAVFPTFIREYLFDQAGDVRAQPLDVTPLNTIVSLHVDDLQAYTASIFTQGWPDEDQTVVTAERLHGAITEMTADLHGVIRTLKKRLEWAMEQMRRLEVKRGRRGTLDPDEDALYNRCDRLVKRFKGTRQRKRREAEGFDDFVTFGVLAAEGFLPGYGLETGSVLGTANVPRHLTMGDFDLPRPPAMALREYVPGNMIYANGHRFVPRYFHLEAVEPTLFMVDAAAEAVAEMGVAQAGTTALSASTLRAVPMCDVDLTHVSHISDDEDYRFQLQVAVFGYELGRHNGGVVYQWGQRPLLHRHGVQLRLVNVGASLGVKNGKLGYPVCLVCGQSRSPMSSSTEQKHFADDHATRCLRPVEPTGFFTDTFADALSLPGCTNRQEAYSVLEALRAGATRVLDMARDDIQVLVIGQPGVETVDALLYDPMPGGSGLFKQITDRFDEVVAAAMDIAENCASSCQSACSDCLCTYRNAYFHRHLDRHLALQRLQEWGAALEASHQIPAVTGTTGLEMEKPPINEAETILRGMLLRAGFPEPVWHHQLSLGKPLGTTTPDCFYPDPEDDEAGVCVYLDGLSEHIHGNPETHKQDQQIREQLRALGYEVIEIAASDLFDRDAMRKKFYRLGCFLLGKDQASAVRNNPEWFEGH